MIFQEEELDASVRDVQAKAILDIAEQNKDIATVRSQKLQMREANKKRLLEQVYQERPKVEPEGLSEDGPQSAKISPDLGKDDQLTFDFSPKLERDEPLSVNVSADLGNGKPSVPNVPVPKLSDPMDRVSPSPEFQRDEFLALEPGKDLGTLAKDGVAPEAAPLPKISLEGLYTQAVIAPEISIDADRDPVDIHVDALIKARRDFERENAIGTTVSPVVGLESDPVTLPEIQGTLEEAEPLLVKVAAKLDDTPMDPFVLLPKVEKDPPIKANISPVFPKDGPLPEAGDAEVENVPAEVNTADAKVQKDGNFLGKADVKADDLDHFFSSYVKTVPESAMAEKIRANLRSPSLVVDAEVEIDNTDSGKIPFVGVPGSFGHAVAEGGSDGNFTDKLAEGAVAVVTNTLKEFVTDVINEAFKEFDENFLGFDLANVLENCLRNIQNSDPGPLGYEDREFRLTGGQEMSLRDMVAESLKGSFLAYSQEDPLATVDWDRYDGMIASIASQLHSVTRGDLTFQEVAGDAVRAWERILGGMLSDPGYSGNVAKRGVNRAVDALVGAGPDLYKNMYDLVLVQVGEDGLLDKMAGGGEAECTIDEFMVNILGNSFIAVRAAGVTVPEMKTKTVDIPVLWTSVTKATQQTEMSKKQTLSIEADQYLFLYDTFMKAAGKFYASSSHGLISPDWKNDLTGLAPIQLGTLCGKSWSDVGFNKKLSTKTRIDMIVKLRNFSPFLMGDGSVAPGKEPYFVFEDVRFLGNGALQFSRADVSKATFDTDFIFRRAYKVNVNSHSGSAEKSTMAHIGAVDYLKPPAFVAPNDPSKISSADPNSEQITAQLGLSSGDSSADLKSLSASRGGEITGGSGKSVDLAKIDQETRDASATTAMSVACSSLLRDVNALVERLLGEFQAGVVGDQPQAHSGDTVHFDAVGPKKPEATSFKFQKPDWKPITNVVTSKVADSLGALAQSRNGGSEDMDSEGAAKAVKQATGSVDRARMRVEQRQNSTKVTGTISKSIRSLDESIALNNANAEKALGD